MFICCLDAQTTSDTTGIKKDQPGDDPSQFISRVEIFNELQHYKEGFNLNHTVVRTVVKIGKRFTTRVDIPYVANGVPYPGMPKSSGLGDISFRLLGYRFMESKKAAFTASLEISMNTAESPVLGTGKNILIPLVSFTRLFPKSRLLFIVLLQQATSIGGDANREDIRFTKIQPALLKFWSKKCWSFISPECFIDYVRDDVSMTLESRTVVAPIPRLNLWLQPGIGLFGDFPTRYDWNLEAGCRYYLFRDKTAVR